MVKLDDKTYEKARRQLYLSGSSIVKLPADLHRYIMLITSSCGRGKSTYALSLNEDGLLADINKKARNAYFPTIEQPEYIDIQPEEMLVLSSRIGITEQQLKNSNVIKAKASDFNDNMFNFEEDSRKGKILATTAHAFGMMIKNGDVKKLPKVIVIDECHSIFTEYFAEQLRYVLDFLKDNSDQMIKIGLTATPEVLLNYVKDFQFKVISADVGEKYLVNKLYVCVNGKANSLLAQYAGKINDDYKLIYYTQSATQCYLLSKLYPKSAFMISKYNQTTLEDKATHEKVNLVEEMRKSGIQEYVLQNEALPEGVNILFINSACREGININDDKVKAVICEAPDMMTIQQVRGRIRRNLEEFMVVANFNNKVLNDNAIKEYCDLIQIEKNSDNPQGLLGERYQKQKGNKAIYPFVYKRNNFFYVNNYAEYYLQYIKETYLMIDNSQKDDNTNRQGHYVKGENSKVVKCGDNDILDFQSYFNQLQRFVVDRQVQIQRLEEVKAEKNAESVISIFKSIENQWMNKPLSTEDKTFLCQTTAIKRKGGKPGNWTSLKQVLIDNGYTIKDKKINTKHYAVISK